MDIVIIIVIACDALAIIGLLVYFMSIDKELKQARKETSKFPLNKIE